MEEVETNKQNKIEEKQPKVQKGDFNDLNQPIEPIRVSIEQENGTYLWDQCYPIGTNQNSERRPAANTVYVTTDSGFKWYQVDLKAKKLSRSGLIPKIYPKEFSSISNRTGMFNFSTKGAQVVREEVEEEGSLVIRFYNCPYKNNGEAIRREGELLGEIREGPEFGYGFKFPWLFEVFQHMISTRNIFLYCFVKEKGQDESKRVYYLGTLSKNHKNSLKKHYSMNFNFHSKNAIFAKRIEEDSIGVDERVKGVLKFQSHNKNRKVFTDDFPDDPDPRYTTFTFIEDKALIASVADLRNKKLVKSSLITVYELFKALYFTSVYHCNGFSLDQRKYSYKKDRLFLRFQVSYDYLDPDNIKHMFMLDHSQDYPSIPHVYMPPEDAANLTRTYCVVVERVSNHSKRRFRILNTSFDGYFTLPGKNEICIIHEIHDQKTEFNLFNESRTGEERTLVLKNSQKMNSEICSMYKIEGDFYVIGDSNYLYLIDFSTGEIHSEVQYSAQLELKNLRQDKDFLVDFNQKNGFINLFRFDDQKRQLTFLNQFSLKKKLSYPGFKLLKIEDILSVKKLKSNEVLMLLRIRYLKDKNRCVYEETFLAMRVPVDDLLGGGPGIAGIANIFPPSTPAQLVSDEFWMVGVINQDGIVLLSINSPRNKVIVFYETPQHLNLVVKDYFYYGGKVRDKATRQLFLMFDKTAREVDAEAGGAGEEQNGGGEPDSFKLLNLYEIADPEFSEGHPRVIESKSVKFDKSTQFFVNKALERPLFFIYENYSNDQDHPISHLRVFDEDLEEVTVFDFSGFTIDSNKASDFKILDNNLFVARLKKAPGLEQPQRSEDDGPSGRIGDREDQEDVYQTFLFDLRTKTRRLLVKPNRSSGVPVPLDVSATPLIFTGEGLVCYLSKGEKTERRDSDEIFYYDLRSRSTSWIGSIYLQSRLTPIFKNFLLRQE